MPETFGRVHDNPSQVEIEYQPDIGWVYRKKHNDIHSNKVLCDDRAFASVMRHNDIAHECGHLGDHGEPTPRAEFFKCLRDKGLKYHNRLEEAYQRCGAR